MVFTIEASGHWAGCHVLLHLMALHCYSSSHLLSICAQLIPRRATGEQWSDAPPRTFHEALLSCLMNLYSMHGLHWLLGLHENAISPHHTPWYLICLECVIGCEVERGAVSICASQVCGYGGTGASHPWKVLYLTLWLGWRVYSPGCQHPVAPAKQTFSLVTGIRSVVLYLCRGGR